jgi:hypothetical protein
MGQQKMSNNSTSLKYVDHTYRDFSRYVEEGGELVKHKKSGNNFPARLHKILSASDPGHSDVITWMVSAECFFVFVVSLGRYDKSGTSSRPNRTLMFLL